MCGTGHTRIDEFPTYLRTYPVPYLPYHHTHIAPLYRARWCDVRHNGWAEDLRRTGPAVRRHEQVFRAEVREIRMRVRTQRGHECGIRWGGLLEACAATRKLNLFFTFSTHPMGLMLAIQNPSAKEAHG